MGNEERMSRKGIDGKVIGRIKKIYEETLVKIRTKEGYTDIFRT